VAIQFTVWIQGLFPDSSLLGDTEMVNEHAYTDYRQMAELVRGSLAEVCPVPLFLVLTEVLSPPEI